MAKKTKRAALDSAARIPRFPGFPGLAGPPGGAMSLLLGYDPTGPMEQRNIKKRKEAVTEITLDDGSVLSIKVAILDVKRAKNQWNQQGDPVYVMQSTQLVSVKSPPHLRRKVKSK